MTWSSREKAATAVVLSAFALVLAVAAIKSPPRVPKPTPTPSTSVSGSVSPTAGTPSSSPSSR